MKRIIFLLLAIFSFGSSEVIQQCMDDVSKTAPNIRFENNDEKGITKDLQTGLIWSRCPMGKTWSKDNKTCEGENSIFNWGQTLLNVKEFNTSDKNTTGISTWRLANIKELLSLKEDSCIFPSLNASVFPNFLDGDGYGVENYIWSSTPSLANKTVFVATPGSNLFANYSISYEFEALLVSDSE